MVVQRQVFRSFWHGSPLNPYQLLCLRSFVDRGHTVEVFTHGRELSVPDWVQQRDAQEIFPTDHVLHYQSGFGAGSPSLHSNLFRYMMLQQLGGWWIDLDVLLLRSDLPDASFFFALGPPPEAAHFVYCGVIKAPAGHGLLNDAVKQSRAIVNADTQWGQLGPCLFTVLVHEHSLMDCSSPAQSAYPVPPAELQLLFDPDRRDHAVERCRQSYFIHLWNEVWRQAGIPQFMGPPAGSFMDWLFIQHDFGFKFSERMKYCDIERWIMNWKAYFERETLIRDQEANMRKLENELSTLAAKNRELEARRAELLASTSWRVTAPFRLVSRSLRRACSGTTRGSG
jgi:Alpha 1,4-glycosyltransferase conserved region